MTATGPIAGETDAEGGSRGPQGADARARLLLVSGQLSAFLARSEAVFLDAGARLGGIHGRAQDLVGLAQKTGPVLGGDAGGPLQRLDRALVAIQQQVELDRAAASASGEGLARLLGRVAALEGAKALFEDTAKRLKLLGLHTSIESARGLGRLASVSEDVRRLAGLIVPTFDSVLARAAALREVAARARADADGFLHKEGARSSEMLTEARSGLDSLHGVVAASTALSERATTTSGRVASAVQNVLVSLQAHDINRQVLEHVNEELGALEQDRTSSPEEWHSDAAQLCALEIEQVRCARERLVEALQRIARELIELSGEVGAQAADAREVVGSPERGSLLGKVVQGLGGTSALLREQLRHVTETEAAVHSVSDKLKEMEGCVGDIREIGVSVKLVAMNAMLQTLDLGTAGAVFAALAREMMDLSVEVAQRTAKVTGALGEIAAEVGRLGGGEAAERAGQAAEGGLADGLDEMLLELRAYHDRLLGGAATLLQGSVELDREVQQVAERLTAEARAAETLRSLEEALQAIAQEARALAGAEALERRSERVEAAAARYTMDAERSVHRAVRSSGLPGAAPADAAGGAGGADADVEFF